MTDTEHFSVLLIDPDPRSLNVLEQFLKKHGFEVLTSNSAKEGYIIALKDRPGAIVFDPRLRDMPAAELVQRLKHDRRTAATRCIALASALDPAEVNRLAEAGSDEYFVKAPDVLEKLADTLKKSQAAAAPSPEKPGGMLIVFLSAKGGTGTSSLCANLAHVVAKHHPELEVALLDMVLPLGSLGPILGYEGEFNLRIAAEQNAKDVDAAFLRRSMTPVESWELRLLAGPEDPEAANKVDASRIPALIRASRQAFDLTVVDLGRSLSRISLPIILEADALVMVMAAELSTVTLTRKVWDHLQSKGLETRRIYPILNRVVGLEGLSKSDAERILGIQIQAAIPYMAGNFTLANNQHIPIIRRFPQDTAAMMLEQIARQMIKVAQQGRA